VAFMCVFFFHGQPGAIFPVFQKFAAWGWSGVELFFVLSGYLITLLLLREKSELGSISVKNFYARRVLRIWPVYFLVLAGLSLFPLTLTHWGNMQNYWEFMRRLILPFSLFVGNFGLLQQGLTLQNFCSAWPLRYYCYVALLLPLWSVCVEEQFYLVWPLLLAVVRRTRALWWTIGSIALLGMASRYALYLWSVKLHVGHPLYYLNTLCHVDGLMFGAALALAEHQYPGWAKGIVSGWKGWAAFAAAIGTLSVIALFARDLNSHHYSIVLLMSVVSLSYALLLLLTLNWSPLKTVLSQRFIASVGRITYAMYIFHFCMIDSSGWICDPICRLLNGVLPRSGASAELFLTQISWVIHLTVALIMTWVAAQVSWNLLEKHVLALRRFFRRDGAQPPVPPLSTAPQQLAGMR
ncbi:MAG: acyltransferase family protein, partial [Terriglobales bacterium]